MVKGEVRNYAYLTHEPKHLYYIHATKQQLHVD